MLPDEQTQRVYALFRQLSDNVLKYIDKYDTAYGDDLLAVAQGLHVIIVEQQSQIAALRERVTQLEG